MAYLKMLWKKKSENPKVKVHVTVKNTFAPVSIRKVKVNVTVRNT